MEILKLAPAYKDYLWGGRNLIDKYRKSGELEKVAETWELSSHPDGPSTIANDPFLGQSFDEYLETKGKQVWGSNGAGYDRFPVLIKFIDAKQALSIQVHPGDDYAWKVEGESGKNEFWYVLEALPDAFLYYGVKEEMTREQFKTRIEDGTICDYLKKVPVKPGDCFFIETGTIHAIGAGIVIAEIQQSSNSTYRVFDFNRLGVDGNPRELHIDKAVEVSRLIPNSKNGEAQGAVEKFGTNERLLLTKNDYFSCTRFALNEPVKLEITPESFQALTIIEGQGKITAGTKTLDLVSGDCIFIPAQSGEYEIAGKVSFILTHI